MVQPTDYIVAKTLVKVLGFFGVLNGLSNVEAAVLLQNSLTIVVGENAALRDAVLQVVVEGTDELIAESDGVASSITSSPIPQPWNEDAGSGA